MEDMFSVAYQQTEDLKELEYAYFGIFDGHGGAEAAIYAKDHLIDSIVCQSNFWSSNDEDILRAIHDGYINTHYAMYKQHEMWPKTVSGLPSTSGTTATIAFIRKGKVYIGHVGDSCIALGYQEKGESAWKARQLTKDHKPECHAEINRIRECGGKVVTKSGVPRVVWNRPRLGHKGPVRRSTPIDEIPFLAVARALGDFWSYNSAMDKFIVSPKPDVYVFHINVERDRCLILGTDGLWNMLSPEEAVALVQATESHNEHHIVNSSENLFMQYDRNWLNPSKNLVDKAIRQWSCAKQRADNTSVVTLLLDRPGPPRTPTTIAPKLPLEERIANNSVPPSSSSSSNCEENGNKISAMMPRQRSSVPYLPQISEGMRIIARSASLSQNINTADLPNKPHVSSANVQHQISPSFPVSKAKKTERMDDISLKTDKFNSSVLLDTDDQATRTMNYSISEERTSTSHSRPDDIERMELAHYVPSTSSPVKRKLGSNNNYQLNKDSAAINRNYPRLKAIRSADSSDDGNSDIENRSCPWSETVSSNSSKNTIVASNYKRKRFSFDKKPSPSNESTCSCRKSASFPCCDKARTNKSRLFIGSSSRMLRSDTIAATPTRTLRSRNINLSASTMTKTKSVETKLIAPRISAPSPKVTNDDDQSTCSCASTSAMKRLIAVAPNVGRDSTGNLKFINNHIRPSAAASTGGLSTTTSSTTRKIARYIPAETGHGQSSSSLAATRTTSRKSFK